ncbi:flagellar hook-length control protein FliK [Blastomonas sp. SL216]|uniref:flagellar hook-length control protein FliK n=1 Tax=Blastomonas sp. SL216 TaxID=2995169 RepID=UPI0023771DDA|nr:flagellar hook-length control protein FliK [Blastomonas sp. SL216]
MSLDANPFASQLALMSGTEASVAGMLAPAAVLPGAGEGAFAATLADVAVPAQPSALAVDGAAITVPAAEAPSVAPVPVALATPVVAPLPEEASASQLIEAALTGAATIAPAPAAPVATPAQAKAPAAPVAEPEAPSLPIQAGTQVPVTVQPLPRAADVPHLKNLIRSDAPMPIQAQLPAEAEPVAADSVSPAAPRPRSRAENADETIQVETPIVHALPLAIAPVQAPRPETPVTDLGTTRIAAEAAPEAPRQPAALHEAAGPVQPAARAPISDPLTAAQAQAPLGQSAAAAVDPVAPAPLAPAPLGVTAESVAEVDQPISAETAAPTTLSSELPHGRKARLAQAPIETVQPAIVQPMPMAAVADAPVVPAPVVSEAVAAPIDTLTPRAARSAPAQQPGIPAPAAAAPQPGQLISPAPDQAAATPPAPAAPLVQSVEQTITAAAPTLPQGVAQPAPQAQAQAQAQLQVQPAAPAQVPDAAEAAPMAMTAPAQAQTAAPAPRTSATRAPISAPARRMVEGAVQAPRPAEALSALFDLADPGIQPAISSLSAEQGVVQSIEAVPPAWAAALNAVSPQVQQPANVGAPLGASNPAQVPVQNLAFDAGFVAGIESQIARLADGGQMVKIQVMPEHLGRIDIEMLAGPERDQVRIVTEHDAVRDTLVSSQHRLEQDLRANGQRNAEVTVELRQQSPGTQNGSAQQQQRGQSGAESASARDAAQRATTSDGQADAAPAPRRPRGNVRYA